MAEVNPFKHEMARDRIAEGSWSVDAAAGQVYGTRGPIGYRNSAGYIHLAMSDGPKVTRISAHRVIWEYVHGPITDPKLQINHLNGDKTDNRIANLELVDARTNVRHALTTGLAHPARGEHHWRTKLTDVQVAEIRRLAAAGAKGTHLATHYGCSKSRISVIVAHKSRIAA